MFIALIWNGDKAEKYIAIVDSHIIKLLPRPLSLPSSSLYKHALPALPPPDNSAPILFAQSLAEFSRSYCLSPRSSLFVQWGIRGRSTKWSRVDVDLLTFAQGRADDFLPGAVTLFAPLVNSLPPLTDVDLLTFSQGRADDFFLPGAVTFFRAPGKFLTAPPIFAFYLKR